MDLTNNIISGFIPQGNAVAGQQRPPNHIIARPQVPGAQMQWMQQQVQFELKHFYQRFRSFVFYIFQNIFFVE